MVEVTLSMFKKGGRYEVVDYKVEYELIQQRQLFCLIIIVVILVIKYESWANVEGRPTVEGQDGKNTTILVPTAWENLKFLWNYQINFMYFRYFMWNLRVVKMILLVRASSIGAVY